MEINFTGKRALVTGAAQGIGLAIVKKLVACGAKVVAVDVQGDKLRDVPKELPGVEPVVVDLGNWNLTLESLKNIEQVQLVVNNAGVLSAETSGEVQESEIKKILDVNLKAVMAVCKLPGVEPLVVDLSDWNATLESLASIGEFQLVVNNAGIVEMKTSGDIEEEDIRKALDVNLKGVMAVCKHAINSWTSSGTEGAIVNISSVKDSRPSSEFPVYSASKAAIVQYTRCLALDCAPKGIRVNAVSPGPVNTKIAVKGLDNTAMREFLARCVPMTEKLSDPEDIANAVAFLLCNKAARRITGVNLPVDAGYMLT